MCSTRSARRRAADADLRRRRAVGARRPRRGPRARQSVDAVKDGWNGYQRRAFLGRAHGIACMLGYGHARRDQRMSIAAKPKLAFFLGADEVDFRGACPTRSRSMSATMATRARMRADVILPAAAWTEKDLHLRSTPRAASSAARRRCSRPAMRARTGAFPCAGRCARRSRSASTALRSAARR